jgi:hypothetical protein
VDEATGVHKEKQAREKKKKKYSFLANPAYLFSG